MLRDQFEECFDMPYADLPVLIETPYDRLRASLFSPFARYRIELQVQDSGESVEDCILVGVFRDLFDLFQRLADLFLYCPCRLNDGELRPPEIDFYRLKEVGCGVNRLHYFSLFRRQVSAVRKASGPAETTGGLTSFKKFLGLKAVVVRGRNEGFAEAVFDPGLRV